MRILLTSRGRRKKSNDIGGRKSKENKQKKSPPTSLKCAYLEDNEGHLVVIEAKLNVE